MVRSSAPASPKITSTVRLRPSNVRRGATRPCSSNPMRTFRHEARKPSSVQGRPLELAHKVTASCFGAASKIAFSALGTGQNTGSPVFDRRVATASIHVRGGIQRGDEDQFGEYSEDAIFAIASRFEILEADLYKLRSDIEKRRGDDHDFDWSVYAITRKAARLELFLSEISRYLWLTSSSASHATCMRALVAILAVLPLAPTR